MQKNKIKNIIKEYVETKNVVLTEQQLNQTLLNEGWKEVLLGIALLTGVNLGQSQAQTAKKVLSNDGVKNQIEKTLSDTTTLNKLTKNLPDDVKNKILTNAEKALEDLSSETGKVSTKITLKDAKQIASRIEQGYVISDIKLDSTMVGDTAQIYYKDTITTTFNSDNLFKTGGYELTSDAQNAIKGLKESVSKHKGFITSIKITASTDKEPIKIGNEKLAQLRAESVSKLFTDIDNINVETLPDQGPDAYKKGMDQTERDSLRKETSKYRYVKIEVSVIFPDIKKEIPVQKKLESNTVTLIKTIESNTGVKKIPHSPVKPKGKHSISNIVKPCKVNVSCVTGF